MTPAWRPDGWEARWRIGVLTPAGDVGPESELRAMAPAGVAVHGARVGFAARGPGRDRPTIAMEPVRAFAEPPSVDDAVASLAAAPLHAIAYGFTSSAYVIGEEGEAAMLRRLGERARGTPVVATCASFLAGLRALGADSVALLDPPWFPDELTDLGRRYFERAGFAVRYAAPCGLAHDQSLIRPEDVFAWATAHVPPAAGAVVVGGNGFRAVGVIEALEEALALPVLTANQALLWGTLGAAGIEAPVTGYGRLFTLPPPR